LRESVSAQKSIHMVDAGRGYAAVMLDADLVEVHHFVVYDDLRKKILRETKLADFLRSEGVELSDVTLGDLIELKAKRPVNGDKVVAAGS
jgi:hypothetical protein